MKNLTFATKKHSDTYFSTFCRLDLMALLFAAFCCFAFSGTAHAKQVEDIDITRAIENELWTDEAVDANIIDVQTREGVVSLTGIVNHILARERAARIAGNMVGVRAVVNQITVEPSVILPDEKLQNAIVTALRNDAATDSYEVMVDTANGEVTLTGTVDSWQERVLCATVTKGVMGVTDVKNDITVDYKINRSDSEITKEIMALLENDVRVDDYLIKVESEDGKVRLSGTVGSLAEKNRATIDAYVAGVSTVDGSALEIEWWARDKMRRKDAFVNRSNAQIKQAVEDAFLYDPRVLSFKPDIAVEDGKVTLWGVVDNLKAKMAAEEDAQNVVGVWHVKNHLKVRPVQIPSDEVLEKRVTDALLANPWINRFEIGITLSPDGSISQVM